VNIVMARKYSKAASKKVERAMHERKTGKLKSGSTGKKVKSRKQAIAIGLSEARAEGKKVPPRSSRSSSSRKTAASSRKRGASSRKTGTRKASSSRSSGRKTSARKSTSRSR
jgi:hypothetical protein